MEVAIEWTKENPNIVNPVRNTKHKYLKFLNSRVFSAEALHFLQNGYYTNAPVGTFAYNDYWDEQERRCLEGYESGGVRITGRHYFFLNFCRMKAIPINPLTGLPDGNKIILTFPRFLDHQYYLFHEFEECFAEGIYEGKIDKQGIIILKSRRKGITYINSGGVYAYNYTFLENSNNIIAAGEALHYKVTIDGIHDCLNFINRYTDFAKARTIDKRDHIRSGRKIVDKWGIESEVGFKSEIRAISLKDNPFKSIGEAVDVLGFEESGKNPQLMVAYQIAEPTLRVGNTMIGVPIIWGCMMKGTKVWTKEGKVVNIEDIKQEDGILGYNGDGVSKEKIVWLKPPAKKICYRIETIGGNFVECSEDHPLMWSKDHWETKTKDNKQRNVTFQLAKNVKIGDHLIVIKEIPIFGDKKLDNARLIGLMIGDGYYGVNQFEIGACDVEIREFIQKNYEHRIGRTQHNKSDGRLYEYIFLKDKNVVQQFKDIGIFGQVKDKKRLPENIHLYDKESLCELLAGYFDADRNIKIKNNKNISIVLTSAVKEILVEVKYQLLKLGVHCTIGCENRKAHKSNEEYGFKNIDTIVYRLYINTVDSVLAFQRNIKLLCKHKQDVIDRILESDVKTHRNIDKAKFFLNVDNKKGTYFIGKENMTGLKYECVKSVECLGEQDVYNLTCEDTHTYISNGFITKQTGGDIELGSRDLGEMFYNPRAYGLKAYENIYDEKQTGECGYFIDDLWFYPGKHKIKVYNGSNSEKVTTEVSMVDNEGNSIRDIALLSLMEKREKAKKGNSLGYQKFITQQPLNPMEALMRAEGSIFPIMELKEQEAEVKVNPIYSDSYRKGNMVITSTGVKFVENPNADNIDVYPHKTLSDGCVVVYEYPYVNPNTGTIPDNMYLGGCLLPGEKVLTDKGLINVENIDSTYKLINEEGINVNINKFLTYDKIEEDVYTIKMCNTLRSTTFTKEHPILVSNHNQKMNWNKDHPIYRYGEIYYDLDFKYETVENVKKGQWVKLPNIYLKNNSFDISTLWINDEYRIDRYITNPLENEEFWWFVGLWLGDGWCEENGRICGSFNKKEFEYLKKYVKIVKKLFNRNVLIREKDSAYQTQFSFMQLNEFLTLHFNKYALNKKLPEWVKRLNPNLKKQLILGYLDSDGSIMKLGKYYSMEFVSINLEMLEGFQDIMFSLGIISSVSKMRDAGQHVIQNRICNTKETYHLRIAHAATIKLAKLLNCPEDIKIRKIDEEYFTMNIREPRVHCFFSDNLEYIYLRIDKITKSKYTGKVYNFDCETHTFMCYHITTHNCDPIDFGRDENASKTEDHSLGVFYLMNKLTERIVCEYVGKPRMAEQFYETVYRILLFYNARVNIESNNKGIFTFLKNKGKEHLICEEPAILKDTVNYNYTTGRRGTRATETVNRLGRSFICKWLLTKIDEDDKGNDIYNLHKIRSIGLLQELQQWNSKGNFDRVSALGMLMILLEDKRQLEVSREETKKNTITDAYWSRMIGGNSNNLGWRLNSKGQLERT